MTKDNDEESNPLAAEPSKERPGMNQPGRQRGTDDTFTGRAAQLAVMAELLRLRCNAAIPEVDLGTDVLSSKMAGRRSSAFK